MGCVCGTHGGGKKRIQNICRGDLKKNLENTGAYGTVLLQHILIKMTWESMRWIDLAQDRD
jgi:hypothetical protein